MPLLSASDLKPLRSRPKLAAYVAQGSGHAV